MEAPFHPLFLQLFLPHFAPDTLGCPLGTEPSIYDQKLWNLTWSYLGYFPVHLEGQEAESGMWRTWLNSNQSFPTLLVSERRRAGATQGCHRLKPDQEV